MRHRLTKITTHAGDKGTTRLGDGSEVPKDHPRVGVLGGLDELNSAIGLVLAEEVPASVRNLLIRIQHELFELGAELSVPGRISPGSEPVAQLEQELSSLNAGLGPLKEFVLPGGTRAAAAAHLARTIGRRTERDLAALKKTEAVSEYALKYLNRLSDLLFVIARSLNRAASQPESLWQPRPKP